jgi:hypothetical protein
MSTRVIERVEEWESRPFSGGYRAIRDLAAEEFSGVVRAEGVDLYMTSGTVVGVHSGRIEDFEDASGTVYEAPTPALPLLAVMQAGDEAARAQYYSEDTAIAEVGEKLEDGGFTGYIELSENVLSGDYYVVYHRGRSMSVAFVGNTGQLLEGDEAFDRADGEVGIYEVYPAAVEPVDIPEPTTPGDEGTGDAAVATTGAATSGDETGPDDHAPEEGDDGSSDDGGETVPPSAAESGPETSDAGGPEDTGRGAGGDDGTGPDAGEEPAATPEAGADPAESDSEGGATRTETSSGAGASPAESTPEGNAARTGTTSGARTDPAESPARSAGAGSEGRTAGARDGDGTAGGGRQADPEGDAAERSDPDGTTTGSDSGRAGARDDTTGGTMEPRGTPPREDRGHQEPGRRPADRGQQSPATSEPATGSVTEASDRGDPRTGGTRETEPRTAGPASSRRLETRAIPSLDPKRSQTTDRTADAPRPDPERPGPEPRHDGPTPGPRDSSAGRSAEHAEAEETASDRGSGGSDPARDREGEARTEAEPAPADEQAPVAEAAESGTGVDPARIEELEDELDDREAEVDRLESELRTATEDRDRLESDLEAVREERDELQAEVERLESELDRLETEFGAATGRDRRLAVEEALDGTDVFVRYHSKGDATLEKAHSSNTRQEDVIENIRLEKHTQFDADAVAIGGQSYTEFIEGTVVYQFVDWVATELLFEIRDTGHTDSLKTLYDALPKIDRAELNGSVDVAYVEDGQETRSSETFDVVLRDRMGNPLVVANLNDSREAATEAMMERLITAAERVGQTSDDFAAAFFVTESFFEPGALETASEVTRGGLLSRSKQKSFVNLSRKRGYHLCLVEARSQNFNLTVPEL